MSHTGKYRRELKQQKKKGGGRLCLRQPARSAMKKKIYILCVITFIIMSFAHLPMGMYVHAAENDVAEEEEPPGAEKGPVHVCAVLQEGHRPSVIVELVPQDDGGIAYTFRLEEENGYSEDRNIMTGIYTCICYVDTENGKYQSVSAVYGGTEETVTEDGSDAPYFVAVAGDGRFIKEHSWLSNYRTEEGTPLTGEISNERLQTLFDEEFAMPENASAPQPGYVDESDDEGAPPEEYESPAVDREDATTQEPSVEEEPAKEDKPAGYAATAAILFCTVLLVAASFMIAGLAKGHIQKLWAGKQQKDRDAPKE